MTHLPARARATEKKERGGLSLPRGCERLQLNRALCNRLFLFLFQHNLLGTYRQLHLSILRDLPAAALRALQNRGECPLPRVRAPIFDGTSWIGRPLTGPIRGSLAIGAEAKGEGGGATVGGAVAHA